MDIFKKYNSNRIKLSFYCMIAFDIIVEKQYFIIKLGHNYTIDLAPYTNFRVRIRVRIRVRVRVRVMGIGLGLGCEVYCILVTPKLEPLKFEMAAVFLQKYRVCEPNSKQKRR